MKVANITKDRGNRPLPAAGVLKVTTLSETHIEVEHTNEDDGFYWYKYDVTGTVEEITAVTAFCNLLTAATAAPR